MGNTGEAINSDQIRNMPSIADAARHMGIEHPNCSGCSALSDALLVWQADYDSACVMLAEPSDWAIHANELRLLIDKKNAGLSKWAQDSEKLGLKLEAALSDNSELRADLERIYRLAARAMSIEGLCRDTPYLVEIRALIEQRRKA